MIREKRATLTLLMILCSVLVAFPNVEIVKAEPKTIVVPDDFASIQEAVDNAPEGGTVFVRSGSYEKRVRIRKPLSLIGENAKNTIIETPEIIYSEAIIFVDSENVTVSGFTIKNCDYAIWAPSRCKIVGNKIENAQYGIAIGGGDNIISGNNITGRYDGIRADLDDSLISGNIITGHRNIGISVSSGKNLTVYNNKISTNKVGVRLGGSGPFYVYGNNITYNEAFGIQLFGCNNSSIYENNIVGNGAGVELENYDYQSSAPGSGNFVYQNNFVNNQQQVVIDKTWNVLQWDLTEYFPDAINGTDSASWHKDKVGNYWSSYKGTDNEGDGIGDSPYIIDEENQDNYPLMAPIKIFDAGIWEWVSYNVDVVSNSSVSDFSFNPESNLVRFNVEGETGTTGFCRITIPKGLLNTGGEWTVLVGGSPVTATVNEDTDNTYLNFTYDHSTKTVEIIGTTAIPEFPSWIVLPLVITTTLLILIYKKSLPKKHQNQKKSFILGA